MELWSQHHHQRVASFPEFRRFEFHHNIPTSYIQVLSNMDTDDIITASDAITGEEIDPIGSQDWHHYVRLIE